MSSSLSNRRAAPLIGYKDGKPVYAAGDCAPASSSSNVRRRGQIVGYKSGKPVYAVGRCTRDGGEIPVGPGFPGELVGYKSGKPVYAVHCCGAVSSRSRSSSSSASSSASSSSSASASVSASVSSSSSASVSASASASSLSSSLSVESQSLLPSSAAPSASSSRSRSMVSNSCCQSVPDVLYLTVDDQTIPPGSGDFSWLEGPTYELVYRPAQNDWYVRIENTYSCVGNPGSFVEFILSCASGVWSLAFETDCGCGLFGGEQSASCSPFELIHQFTDTCFFGTFRTTIVS